MKRPVSQRRWSVASWLEAPSTAALQLFGFLVAVASVVLPALPLGPLFQQPPFPLAVLWAAFAWAVEDDGEPRGDALLLQVAALRAPLLLALLGLLHDQLSGGPFGLMATIYLSAFITGRFVNMRMGMTEWHLAWGAFIVTAVATIGVAFLIAPVALGPNVSVRQYAEAVGVTALLFPLARPFYMNARLSVGRGARR
ncbi:MAG: hypothetical protein K2P58_08455 [Hyphomonadaceae bacterium]|nr:hypothetical protein [Hyphomonadaceae bacterium]